LKKKNPSLLMGNFTQHPQQLYPYSYKSSKLPILTLSKITQPFTATSNQTKNYLIISQHNSQQTRILENFIVLKCNNHPSPSRILILVLEL